LLIYAIVFGDREDSILAHITIKDIARLAGVSYTTVSRALNNTSEINSETRARILEICRQEGYRTNLLARSLSSHRTNLIGLIIPDIASPFFSELYLNIETYALDLGYQVMLCNGQPGDGKIEELFEFLIGHRADGIILVSSINNAHDLFYKYSQTVPTVLLGDCVSLESNPVNIVSVDNALGGRMAAEYLYHLGHRKVLYMGRRPGSIIHERRYGGFVDAARELGLRVRVIDNPGSASTIESGYQLAKQVFLEGFEETAAFAAADAIAMGIMQSADEFGVSIPDQFSLLGFDNISYSALPNIRLTTLDQQKNRQAKATMDLLLDLIRHPDRGEYTRRLICPVLLERSSCRKVSP